MAFEATSPTADRLRHFPVSFFASVMGLAGLSIAHIRASHLWPELRAPALVLIILTAALFLALAVIYAIKFLRHREAVAEEFTHPVRLHFIPTISIALILLSIAFLEIDTNIAHALFAIGAPAHLLLTLVVLNQWLHRDSFQVPHLNPAWFIPIVGNILVPIPGVALGYESASWLFFAIGIVFWPLLFAIILNRILFHQPLPERLTPTLFILLAPPAVGFLAYLRLTGSLDAFARVLYFFALFLVLFLATQIPRLARLRFFLSWWAYSFPLAAITIASFAMHERTGAAAHLAIAVGLLAVSTLVIAGLVLRTAVAVRRGEICVPE
jgi:tellurite resistance protein